MQVKLAPRRAGQGQRHCLVQGEAPAGSRVEPLRAGMWALPTCKCALHFIQGSSGRNYSIRIEILQQFTYNQYEVRIFKSQR